ncbi:hypothetical protein [Zooshikella ganghwensis]|uniref:hypothetical protein n=1 Tax=Zooshikella ganghwensis TaxID=202772 RepID=UPI00040691B3|nr:hypothetical protein [Zooshikella ganghwensis]
MIRRLAAVKKMMGSYIRSAFIILCTVTLAGCDDAPSTKEKTSEHPVSQNASEVDASGNTAAAVDSKPLYKVNDAVIREQDVQLAIERTLGNSVNLQDDDALEEKILQSLVQSQAMAQMALSEMSDQEKQKLEGHVNAYREEQLVKSYLTKHTKPVPVTAEHVQQYYQAHPEEFSAGVRKTFQVFSSTEPLSPEQQQALVTQFGQLTMDMDWQAQAQQWQQQKLPVRLQQTTLKPDLLPEPLRALVADTPAGSLSRVYTDQPTESGDLQPAASGQIAKVMRVKVLKEVSLGQQALPEVADKIRQKLAPLRIQQAVKEAAAKAMAQVTVTDLREEQPK